ncbi:hypothetical protein F7734_10630 [Scytonema sp. UIC 10036]|uniref:hypothetical protein n=1 Tax=Scytonema sp. UIC 10036 TaxID=2304196 RepID=UPI0012DA43A3|nr:hypothetical protein [Scytonema sp. UIC 10036]MUG92880.1 hypothetical protein [Scytonema sp. UIC 10036]
MAQIQQQPSSLPPRKQRDPSLARSKEELLQRQEEYIGEMVKSAARESLREGTMRPISVRIGREGKIKLHELQDRLRAEQKILLNMAFAYAYHEAKRNQVSVHFLRTKIEAIVNDEENVLFEIDESTLDILFDSRIQDAQFIYLNAGIDLLYSRLVKLNTASAIWD